MPYLVVDNAFNRIWCRDMIGQTFKSPPSTCAVEVVRYESSKAKRKTWQEDIQLRAEARALGKAFAMVLIGTTALLTIAAVSESRR